MNLKSVGQRLLAGERESIEEESLIALNNPKPPKETSPYDSSLGINTEDLLVSPIEILERIQDSNQIHSSTDWTKKGFEAKSMQITRYACSCQGEVASAVDIIREPHKLSINRIDPQNMTNSIGFDIVGALVKMSTRPNPKITLGPIDLSCAFVVSDIRAFDCPIVYVSPTFEDMTGFSSEEILGRNCRFLQHPTQDVFQGSQRSYTDHSIIQKIKTCVVGNGEGQFTMVNYKKTGEPFLNHLTLIPLALNGGTEYSHYLGLQIDLIAQPQAIMNRLQNGTYAVNYHQDNEKKTVQDLVSNEYCSHLLSLDQPEKASIDSSISFVEMLPDFIHVLSLRGLFLHVSAESCKKLLEYESDELIGHKISEFVHPSDLVTVMRDLRNCSAEGSVNFICRMRRKRSGYLYMEMNGHVYSGSKRNRCFVIAGRERPILNIPQNSFYIPEPKINNETWIKTSPQGLILFATASASSFFGISPVELTTMSLFDWIEPSDHGLLNKALVGKVSESFTTTLNVGAGPGLFCLFYFLTVDDRNGETRWVQIKKEYGDLDRLARDTNLFSIIQGVRSSSIYYESNKIRVKNARLLEEIVALSDDL